MVACRGCVGDRACGGGYKTLGVHVRLPARERGDGAAVRATGATNVDIARSTLRESVPAAPRAVRRPGRGLREESKLSLWPIGTTYRCARRSEEHTSEL